MAQCSQCTTGWLTCGNCSICGNLPQIKVLAEAIAAIAADYGWGLSTFFSTLTAKDCITINDLLLSNCGAWNVFLFQFLIVCWALWPMVWCWPPEDIWGLLRLVVGSRMHCALLCDCKMTDYSLTYNRIHSLVLISRVFTPALNLRQFATIATNRG